MQRSLVVVFVLVLTAVAGSLWWLSRGQVSVPLDSGRAASGGQAAEPAAQGVAMASSRDEAPGSTKREAVDSPAHELLGDPEIAAALTGFKGRVVNHRKEPVPDAGVRIYRGAMDTVLQETVDLFAEEPTLAPQYVAGETRTAADGTFLIPGVWPRAFYVLLAGIGTDAPMHQILSHTPSPGEIVDLGDVVLPETGVIVGLVLDDDGDPLPGALVRATDLPGMLAAFLPVERFDPEGAVLIREAGSPIKVVEMPAWVRSAFEHLPIPSTRSDTEGRFRLAGVVPGSNLLATTAAEHLSDVKPSVVVRAGQVKDVGNVKLKHGEELTGRVLDSAGKPVADAEVLAGSTLAQVPFDFARRLASTDADGRFEGKGFSGGKVSVAARRGRGHAWVLAEPQPILGDVVVTLPATHGVAVTVTLADGSAAKNARLKLLSGDAGDGATEMAVFGFVPPVDLRDRLTLVGEGKWRIENLVAGKYSLVADAPGHATGFQAFEIADADASTALQLTAKRDFLVRVSGPEDEPIRNAAIYAEAVGNALFDMAIHCGRTNAEGRLVIDKLQGHTLRVSADHPRWGVVHGEAKLGEELVLRMEAPGSLRGVLTENGRPPELGKFTLFVAQEDGDGPRGPIEMPPALVTPRPDGSFGVKALQPGEYRVGVIGSLDTLRSPGSLSGLFTQYYSGGDDMPSSLVTVHAAATAEVRLDAGVKPIEGPAAHLFGTVTIDGRLAAGNAVMCHGEDRNFHAKVDESGRFDLGTVPAEKNLAVHVMATGDTTAFGEGGGTLWVGTVTLALAEERALDIRVVTSSVSGTCYRVDGSLAAGLFVQAQGRLKGVEADRGDVWLGATTDRQGRFQFPQISEGTWTFEARGFGELAGRGKVAGIVVAAGTPHELRIDMQKTITVKGRLDLTGLGDKKPDSCWISFHAVPAEGGDGVGDWCDGAGVDLEDGGFTCDDLAPGRYRVRVHLSTGEEDEREHRSDDIEVPPQGLDKLVLRIGEAVKGG
ncbi:MAG TPA: hypothetical protein VF384_17555 [Planctomycetota bacterium]